MNSKYEQFVGLTESEFKIFQSELGLDDKLMQNVLKEKFDMPGSSLKWHCIRALLNRDLDNKKAAFTVYRALFFKDKNCLVSEDVKQQTLMRKLYNKYIKYI